MGSEQGPDAVVLRRRRRMGRIISMATVELVEGDAARAIALPDDDLAEPIVATTRVTPGLRLRNVIEPRRQREEDVAFAQFSPDDVALRVPGLDDVLTRLPALKRLRSVGSKEAETEMLATLAERPEALRYKGMVWSMPNVSGVNPLSIRSPNMTSPERERIRTLTETDEERRTLDADVTIIGTAFWELSISVSLPVVLFTFRYTENVVA